MSVYSVAVALFSAVHAIGIVSHYYYIFLQETKFVMDI
jgi:hypothetical protein